MHNIKLALDHLNVDSSSTTGSVQDIRKIVDSAEEQDRRSVVAKLSTAIFGKDVTPIGYVPARIMLQYAVCDAVKKGCAIDDVDATLTHALRQCEIYMARPTSHVHWVGLRQSHLQINANEVVSTVRSVVPSAVVVQAPAKVNKGTATREMFKRLVVDADIPMTRLDFKQQLIQVLNMTPLGANTYISNVKSAFAAELKAKDLGGW